MAKKLKSKPRAKPVKSPAKSMKKLPEPEKKPPAAMNWKVVLTKLEKEFSTEAEARAFFDLRSRRLAAGERLVVLKHPA